MLNTCRVRYNPKSNMKVRKKQIQHRHTVYKDSTQILYIGIVYYGILQITLMLLFQALQKMS